MTGSVEDRPRLHPGLVRAWRSLVDRGLRALDRLRLPGATVLPVAGAVVGLYGGLAAGIFANLIGAVGVIVFGWPRRARRSRAPSSMPTGTPSTSSSGCHWRSSPWASPG